MELNNPRSFNDLVSLLKSNPEELNFFLRTIHNKHYKLEEKIKSDGRIREIRKPFYRLKIIQKSILHKILDPIKVAPQFYGVRGGQSSYDANAKYHIGKKCRIRVDIKDFYPSMHSSRISNLLKSMGFSEEISKILTRLTTRDYQLPQGAPTSPCLTRLYLNKRLVPFLDSLGKKYNFKYSIYGDDICVSGEDFPVIEVTEIIIGKIEQLGFKVNRKKTEMSDDLAKTVKMTGFNVGQSVSLPSEYIDETKKQLSNLSSYTSDFKIHESRVRGRILHIRKAHPSVASELAVELQGVKQKL